MTLIQLQRICSNEQDGKMIINCEDLEGGGNGLLDMSIIPEVT
jgi:hypothetical protein